MYNNKYDADAADGEVMKSDHRNGERLEESRHWSFNSDGLIRDQGGRSMVCILIMMKMMMPVRERRIKGGEYNSKRGYYKSQTRRSVIQLLQKF